MRASGDPTQGAKTEVRGPEGAPMGHPILGNNIPDKTKERMRLLIQEFAIANQYTESDSKT
jgi:hypothetical protein